MGLLLCFLSGMFQTEKDCRCNSIDPILPPPSLQSVSFHEEKQAWVLFPPDTLIPNFPIEKKHPFVEKARFSLFVHCISVVNSLTKNLHYNFICKLKLSSFWRYLWITYIIILKFSKENFSIHIHFMNYYNESLQFLTIIYIKS